MAALSPERDGEGKKTFNSFVAFSLNSPLAETPPAKTIDFVSGYFLRARESFSRRISIAVFSKLAAKSATSASERRFLSSEEGKSIPTPTSFWTALKTAVFRPEKEKSRSFTFGWGK